MLDLATAQAALASHKTKGSITADQVRTLLANKSVQFAQITQCTRVQTAAKFKAVNIVKVTNANVQLFSKINEFTSVYANAVKRSAARVESNAAANVEAFTAQQNYFEHTDCYSLVQHKVSGKQYLYVIYNNAQSLYFIDGVPATRQEVAAYLTPSAAERLTNPQPVRNATHDIEHTVTVRTIELANIVSITANRQVLSVEG